VQVSTRSVVASDALLCFATWGVPCFVHRMNERCCAPFLWLGWTWWCKAEYLDSSSDPAMSFQFQSLQSVHLVQSHRVCLLPLGGHKAENPSDCYGSKPVYRWNSQVPVIYFWCFFLGLQGFDPETFPWDAGLCRPWPIVSCRATGAVTWTAQTHSELQWGMHYISCFLNINYLPFSLSLSLTRNVCEYIENIVKSH
jgi:hypothetical protein